MKIVSPQLAKYCTPPLASGNISPTSGKQFPIVISTPATICIMIADKMVVVRFIHPCSPWIRPSEHVWEEKK